MLHGNVGTCMTSSRINTALEKVFAKRVQKSMHSYTITCLSDP